MIAFLKRNIANLITFLRFICVIILLFDFKNIMSENPPLIHIIIAAILFLVICLSDFLDGRIARRLGITSDFGASFDVFTDVFYVLSTTIILSIIGKLPIWCPVLIIEKTANYYITSALIQKKQGDKFAFIRDPIGKVVSASYFFIPIAVFIFHIFFPQYPYIIYILIVPQAIAGIISSVKRFLL